MLPRPDDAAVGRTWDTAKHLIEAFKLFDARAFRWHGNRIPPPGAAGRSLAGITPAPIYVTHSAERQRQA